MTKKEHRFLVTNWQRWPLAATDLALIQLAFARLHANEPTP
jgi:hypothetical protein